jgi:hypothetical protein
VLVFLSKRTLEIAFQKNSALLRVTYTKLSQSTWDGHYLWRMQRTGLPARGSTGNHVLKLVMAR